MNYQAYPEIFFQCLNPAQPSVMLRSAGWTGKVLTEFVKQWG